LYRKKANILGDKAQYFFVSLIILITANCLSILTDEFLLGVFLFTFSLFILKNKEFDIIVLYVLSAWIAINIISYGINKTSFSAWAFTGFIVKIFYPYFILKLVGVKFFEKLEKIVFILTCISLPFFAIQILFPGIINIFNPAFRNITSEEMLSGRGWYGIIFRIDGSAPFRNAGFMWEPGAFAFMLLLVLLYRILRSGSKLDFINIIYIIALLTTFSTMAYLGIAVLLFAYAANSKKIGVVFLTIPLAFLYMGFVSDLDFMFPKIQNYFFTINRSYVPAGQTYLKVNRVAYILFSFRQSLSWPFGYGIVPSKYMYSEYNRTMLEGVGTIAKILIYWGWIGLVFFITAIYKLFKILQIKTNRAFLLLAVLILIIAFFSNPLEKSPVLYSIVFYPFIYKKKPGLTIKYY